MRKLLLWLVMVAVMIAAILGGTAAFLYSRTGTDALPQEAVTFGEQTLEPNGWSWVIPVLGDKVNKTYESPTNLTVQKLGTFTDTVPQLVLPDWVTAAELQIIAFRSSAIKCNAVLRSGVVDICGIPFLSRTAEWIMNRDGDFCPVHGSDQGIHGSFSAVGDRNLCDGHVRKHVFRSALNGIGDLSGRAAPFEGICGDQYVHVQDLLANTVKPPG